MNITHSPRLVHDIVDVAIEHCLQLKYWTIWNYHIFGILVGCDHTETRTIFPWGVGLDQLENEGCLPSWKFKSHSIAKRCAVKLWFDHRWRLTLCHPSLVSNDGSLNTFSASRNAASASLSADAYWKYWLLFYSVGCYISNSNLLMLRLEGVRHAMDRHRSGSWNNLIFRAPRRDFSRRISWRRALKTNPWHRRLGAGVAAEASSSQERWSGEVAPSLKMMSPLESRPVIYHHAANLFLIEWARRNWETAENSNYLVELMDFRLQGWRGNCSSEQAIKSPMQTSLQNRKSFKGVAW